MSAAASYHGKGGALTLGGTAVGQIQEWTVSESVDVAETTSMGDSSRSYLAGIKGFEGSADVLYMSSDNTEDAGLAVGEIQIGTTYAAIFYPAGTSGNISYSGNVIVTGVEVTANFEDAVSASITFQGTGNLTIDHLGGS